ncbi:C-type mannose receptor 2-like [Centroberyx affinis]|uniref:C-type mannose receptor 2-like n=1 Tax=Centroberyx affinis TaxID=166261 RepID=UPI003A5BFF31
MEGKAFVIMVLSGLCALPSCFPRQYHLVEENKIWTEAQSYCREKFTDLATVDNQEDVAKLNDIIGSYSNVWIGLYDINHWRWSLENEGYYGEGEAEFRNWASIEPNDFYTETCAGMRADGTWWDGRCSDRLPFICYNGAIEAQDSSRFVFVNESKTWTEAQSYCREKFTDLVSVKNQAENDEIKVKNQGHDVWIGLFRDSWKWSDGRAMSFTNWNTENNQPGNIAESCVASGFGKWENQPCSERSFFACYTVPVTKQVVRVKLTKTDSTVDLEDMKEAILQQMNQRLKDQGLSGNVKLRWVKQPDGKIFHKEEEEEKKEESCNLI